MNTISTASTNVSASQEDYSSLARKMKKIQLMLSSLKQDEEDEMIHLQQLIEKGQQVEDRVKNRMNQCEQLKDFMKTPLDKKPFSIEVSGKLERPLKQYSLQSKRRESITKQAPLMRLKTSFSPDFFRKNRKKSGQLQKKSSKLKSFEQLRKQNRLQQLTEYMKSSLQNLKTKQSRQTILQKQISLTERHPIDKKNTISQSPIKMKQDGPQQSKLVKNLHVKNSTQANSITFKLVIILALGLLFGFFTYF